jgi:hypothetical protein
MNKTKTPSIRYIVNVGYNKYVFDTIEKAARFVDLLAQGDKISYDYSAPKREDHARPYYKEAVTVVAEIEAVNMILNDKPTPEAVEEPAAAEVAEAA